MLKEGKIYLAKAENRELFLLPQMTNRHGLIAGATGTGKTVTMKVMAESFSDMGVPVFLADVKGDLSGMCLPGSDSGSVHDRLLKLGLEEEFEFRSFPTRFWDIFGEFGHPVRVTISEMGPTLLARLLNLTAVQTGVLNIVFRVADDHGLLLLDLKDLRAMLQYVGDNRAEFTTLYGNVSASSIGAIQRALLTFEEEGGKDFFVEKPRIVFFFDEAHLLFTDCPKTLVQKIVQTVRLIRSKGVGIYFVTQNPSDLPDEVLAQLSNRVQHALRAYTPAEQKSVRAAAKGFRENPLFDTETALKELGVGEALVSFLDNEGIPAPVERAHILPPQSLSGVIEKTVMQTFILADEFEQKYRESYDRESAYEIIISAYEELEEQRVRAKEEAEAEKERLKADALAEKQRQKDEEAAVKAAERETEKRRKTMERAARAATASVAHSVSTNIVNSVMGGKKTDTKTIMKRAATSALSSVMRNGSSSIIRGLLGNIK